MSLNVQWSHMDVLTDFCVNGQLLGVTDDLQDVEESAYDAQSNTVVLEGSD